MNSGCAEWEIRGVENGGTGPGWAGHQVRLEATLTVLGRARLDRCSPTVGDELYHYGLGYAPPADGGEDDGSGLTWARVGWWRVFPR